MSGLERLGQQIAREQDALRARTRDRAQVRERIAAARSRPAPARRGLRVGHAALAGVVLAAAAAALVAWQAPAQPAPLVLRVGPNAEEVHAGAWIEAPAGDRPLALKFSDGTRIEMAPRARARLVAVDAHGAHLLLESGHARVAVVRRPNAAWRLSVGPFAVRVIGTRFDVRWNPEQDDFQLELAHGQVELSGCVFGDGYRMQAGQAIDASCRRGHFHIADHPQPPLPTLPPALTPAPAPALTPAPAPAPARALARPHSRSHPRLSPPEWRPLAERGKYVEAFAAAHASGFTAECARADADDLALLADAARYAGAADREAHALLLLRRRFAGTQRAALAAFALGRLEFDQRHSHAKAARWFATYLKEQPRGPLTREARGRLIEATLGAGQPVRARELAADYLEDHPSGPHAELARDLVESGAD